MSKKLIKKWEEYGLLANVPENKKKIISSTLEEGEKLILLSPILDSDKFIFPLIIDLMLTHNMFKVDVKHLKSEIDLLYEHWTNSGVFDVENEEDHIELETLFIQILSQVYFDKIKKISEN